MKKNPPRLTFYTKEECHLCHVALEIVDKAARKVDFILESVDITTDPELEEKFGEKIPMLYINGSPAFKFHVDEKKLIRKLKEASRESSDD